MAEQRQKGGIAVAQPARPSSSSPVQRPSEDKCKRDVQPIDIISIELAAGITSRVRQQAARAVAFPNLTPITV